MHQESSESSNHVGSCDEDDDCENDAYWNHSRLESFNFEDDGPTMIVTSLRTAGSDVTSATSSVASSGQAGLNKRQTSDRDAVTKGFSEIDFEPDLGFLSLCSDIDNSMGFAVAPLAAPNDTKSSNNLEGNVLLPQSPRDMVERIFITGFPVHGLEQFRSLESKLKLLEAAIEIGDTPTLQTIVLYLRGSLKPSLFQQELMARPVALRAYLNYLRFSGESGLLLEQLLLAGLTEELAESRYSAVDARLLPGEAAASTLSPALMTTARVAGLASAAKTSQFVGTSIEKPVADEVSLFELQAKIEEIDAITVHSSAASGPNSSTSDDKSSQKTSLIGRSLTETVRYCARYHANDPETHFASPTFLRQKFGLSAEQYTYSCVSGFAAAKNYPAIDTLLEAKTWLGRKKLTSAIGFDKISDILHANAAPVELIERYVAYVDDVDERADVAKRVGAMTSLVNCYVQSKRRSDLEKLLATLPRDSTAAVLAQASLNNPSIKWKNT